MAEVGGMLATAVLKVVGAQIGSALGGQIALQQGFNDDLEDMKTSLESVSALLHDAERRSIREETVRLWLKRLKNAMYDISNMIDEFEVDTKPSAAKCAIMIPCLTIGPKLKMANKMKLMREKLEKITKQHKDFGFMPKGSSNVQQVLAGDRATSPRVEEEAIVGRDQDKLKILASLSNKSMTQDFIILPIYGFGGIGKTTLAQLIFSDKEFKDYSHVWVYVSQMFDLNKIESSIISQLSRSEPTITDLEMIPTNMKILIVLDDLWETDGFKLDKLNLLLKFGKEAKVVVIVTTRNKDLARRFCTIEPYKIEPLLDDMCWKIIKQKSAFENRDDKELLENIGREIAMKCGGVPLATQCLGYLLHSKRLDVWQSVKDSDIWNESTSEDTSSLDHVLASLKLSYISMMPCLKLCFGYCAIFPKGHKIIKDDLIYQWISLGFIQPSNMSSPRQLGETYVTNLLGMSFLQHLKSPSPNGQHDEVVTFFTMHDLVHDLARSVMGDEILDTSRKCHNGESNCQYALLADCSIRLELYVKVRALRFLHSDKSVLINDTTFSTAKYLRVLDLKECSIHHLPASLEQLKLLRYLSAPGVQDAMIPTCITKLSKLSYLNLSGSSAILALPDSIGEMGSLLYLDLSDCSGIEQLPESFSKLKNLVHLDLSNCSNVTRLSESLGKLTRLNYLNLAHCKNIGHPENSFGSLTQLQYLNLSRSSYIKPPLDSILGSFTKLKYLNLSTKQNLNDGYLLDTTSMYLDCLPEGLGNCIELEYLNLSGCAYLQALPQSFGELINLVHLDLSGCVRVKGDLEALHTLTKLRYLNLSSGFGDPEARWHPDGLPQALQRLMQLRYLNLSTCIDTMTNIKMSSKRGPLVESILASISTLSNLEHLDLSSNYCVRSVPESICSLTRLHTLDLSWCTTLHDIPEGIADMDSLKFVYVNGYNALDKSRLIRVNKVLVMLPNFVVHANEGEASSNLVLLKDVNPPHLEISSLEIVKSVKEAQRIKLREKQSMVHLKLEWTRETKGFVEDMEVLGELVPPSSLREFTLKGYNGVSFPAWLMGISPCNLPNLVRVELVGLSQCSRLPPLGQLPCLQEVLLREIPMVRNIDRGFCGGVEAFSKLTKLLISDMDNLEEWTTTYSYGEDVVDESFMFPNLKYLQIINCHKLRLNPCPPRVLNVMCITDSDGVLSPNWGERVRLPHRHRHSHSTTSSALVANLRVRSCKAPMHQWRLLHHLPALNILSINHCSDMPISPEINPAFFSFHELYLCGNDSAELPKWLGGLTSLKRLVITRCKALEGWEDFIRRCTSLESLELSYCQSITSLPQWLGNLTSLRALKISDCDKLDNLEGSIRHLSSLESLTLEFCESIQALPEWLGDLKFLQKLHIVENDRILSLPESIRQLANLEELYIRRCPALSQWCESEENKMKIAHIKWMQIRGLNFNL